MIAAAIKSIQVILKQALSEADYQWLASGVQKIETGGDAVNDLLSWSAGVRRKLGSEILGEAYAPLQPASEVFLPVRQWSYADAGRALLILSAVQNNPGQASIIVQNYFQQGDDAEVAAITRLLILFDNGEQLNFYAREAGRTNSKPLFAALAQYNPYPAKYYTDHEFNQLVLKALFMGVGIEPVLGLVERANPELSQMCEDYINERVAAGRDVPADIWLALEPFASPEGEKMLSAYSADPAVEHRYFAVKALQRNLDKPGRRTLLEQRAAIETDTAVRALLDSDHLLI